jgi:membrane-bound lytic murein transglycosylase D
MNSPSPLVPQGSLLEQKDQSRARVRLAVYFVISIHVVGLMALLMQGCRKPPEPVSEPPPTVDTNVMSAVDTNEAAANMNAATNAAPPPSPVYAAPTPAPAAAQEYTVAKGDTFSSIAKKFGVTVKQVEEANPTVQPTKMQIGQKLQIPAPASGAPGAAAAAVAPAAESSAGEKTYTVKSGDTLTKIAGEFGTTVKAIRSENGLTTDKIVVGQKLKIPAKTAAPTAATPPQ